jgi:hypothetical protein
LYYEFKKSDSSDIPLLFKKMMKPRFNINVKARDLIHIAYAYLSESLGEKYIVTLNIEGLLLVKEEPEKLSGFTIALPEKPCRSLRLQGIS